MKENFVWVMKSVNKDMSSSHNPNFIYPEQGMVEAEDWKDTPECGNGLHGFLWGEGDGGLADYSPYSRWLLIQVNPKDGLVQMEDKCKFRRGEVMIVGDYHKIASEMCKHLPNDRPYRVIGAVITRNDDSVIVGGDHSLLEGGDRSTVTGGEGSTVTGGWRSTVTGGEGSTVTGGDCSTVTGGDCSTVMGGDHSTVTGGDGSTVTGGWRSTVTGGDGSTVTGGDGSTVTGGDDSTVTGGWRSTVTGGDGSTVTGGDDSTVTGGINSIIILEYYDGNEWKKKAGTIGENGLLPNVPYKLNDKHEFVKAE